MARRGGREQESDGIIETVVKINRCAAVVKGGRRFSFSAVVVVGDANGKVGVGFGKAREVQPAVEKGVKDARKNMYSISRIGDTIPHEVTGRFGGARVRLIPAAPGTGVIAGASARAVVEAAGIRNILTKAYGSANPLNLVKATFEGLRNLRLRNEVERLRGVKIEKTLVEKIQEREARAHERFAPVATPAPRTASG